MRITKTLTLSFGVAFLSSLAMDAMARTDSYEIVAYDSTRSDEEVASGQDEKISFDYTLAFDYYTSLRNPSYKKGSEVYQAFILTVDNATLYAGSEITAINVTSGTYKDTQTNTIKNITVFLSEGLDKEPFYTQSAKLGDEGGKMYSIPLDAPYLIEGDKQIVIGYYFKLSSDDVNYISVDGVRHENTAGGWIGNKVGSGSVEWMNVSQNYGNLCIGCTIEGLNLAQNGVAVLSMSGTEFAEPNTKFPYIMYFQNVASNDVTSMEVAYSVGEEVWKETVNLSKPLSYNQRLGLQFNNLESKQMGIDIPVRFEITKVNGVPNVSTDKSSFSYLNCFKASDGFKKVHLLEEGTGTWCQWCPAGIVMMENIKENFPESYALVAVHSNDVMAVSSTSDVLKMFPGLPAAMIDRAVMISPTNESVDAQIAQYTQYYKDIPSFVGVTKLNGVKTEDNILKVNTGIQFALDLEYNNRYRLSYYLIENGLGPYVQNNSGYSGGTVSMGGWESKPLTVETTFYDVARLLVGGSEGIPDSMPVSIEGNKEYEYQAELSLANITKDNINVIAFIVDDADGTIVNSYETTVDLTSNNVNSVENSNDYAIKAEDGHIAINGNYYSAKVYSMSGELLANMAGDEEISLSAGIYIVVVDGSATKVVVK